MINIYLDDLRGKPTPDPTGEGIWKDDTGTEWYVVRSYRSCLEALKRYNGTIDVLSLDHDLGMDPDLELGREASGYDVLNWIEEQVVKAPGSFTVPRFRIHSANPTGRKRMLQAINAICSPRRD